jgi:hypothetical protein
MPRPFISLLLLATVALVPDARAGAPPLLEDAVKKWVTGTDEWAFTQRVRTYDEGDKLKLERLERYDPSRPDSHRWELLEIDGKPPTEAHRNQWQHRKNRKPRKPSDKVLNDYFDFEHATVAAETAEAVRYDVPVRKEAVRLLPVEKFAVQLTVNKKTRLIEQVVAGLRSPIRIALGMARITDVDLDVRFDPIVHDFSDDDDDPSTKASGTAHVVLFKMGDRAEYSWSDFKQVKPAPPGVGP